MRYSSIHVKHILRENKDRIISLIKILLALALIVYLVSAVKPEEISSALKEANYSLIILAFFLSFLNISLQYYKWKIICLEVVQEPDSSTVLTSLLYGYSAGIVTPFRIGEYVGRALAFPEKKVLKVTVGTLIDKFFGFIPVVFIGAVSALVFFHYYFSKSNVLVVSALVLLAVIFYVFMYSAIKTNFWESLVVKGTSKIKFLSKYAAGLKSFKLLKEEVSLKVAIVTLLIYLTYILQYGILVAAFSNQWHIIDYCWLGMLVFFVKAVIPPVTFGELGIREGASVYFTAKLGLTSATGFNSAIFLFLINVLLPSIPGLLLLIKSGKSKEL